MSATQPSLFDYRPPPPEPWDLPGPPAPDYSGRRWTGPRSWKVGEVEYLCLDAYPLSHPQAPRKLCREISTGGSRTAAQKAVASGLVAGHERAILDVLLELAGEEAETGITAKSIGARCEPQLTHIQVHRRLVRVQPMTPDTEHLRMRALVEIVPGPKGAENRYRAARR